MSSRGKPRKKDNYDSNEDEEQVITKKKVVEKDSTNGKKKSIVPQKPSTKKDKDEDSSSSLEEEKVVEKKSLRKKPAPKKKASAKQTTLSSDDDSNSESDDGGTTKPKPVIQKASISPKLVSKPKKPAAAGNGISNNQKEEKKKPQKRTTSDSSSSSDEDNDKDGEKSDDEDIDEERLKIVTDILSGNSEGTKNILPDNIGDFNMPDIKKFIPKKKLANDLDIAVNEMLKDGNFDIDRLVEIAMENGGKTSDKQKTQLRNQLNKVLGGLNPFTQTCTFLEKVLVIGIRYSKTTKDYEGVGFKEEMEEYRNTLKRTLLNRNESEKMKHAKIHTDLVRAVFTRFKDDIRQSSDHMWIIDQIKQNDTGIEITFGKAGKAVIPISKIYSCVTNVDNILAKRNEKNKKKETKEERDFRLQVENDAGELEHHLWKLFSLVAEDPDERGVYEDRAYILIKSDNDSRTKLAEKGKSLQHIYANQKENFDENGNILPGVLLGNVLTDLCNSKDDGTMQGIIRDINRGTFDIAGTINAVKREAEKDEKTEGEEKTSGKDEKK